LLDLELYARARSAFSERLHYPARVPQVTPLSVYHERVRLLPSLRRGGGRANSAPDQGNGVQATKEPEAIQAAPNLIITHPPQCYDRASSKSRSGVPSHVGTTPGGRRTGLCDCDVLSFPPPFDLASIAPCVEPGMVDAHVVFVFEPDLPVPHRCDESCVQLAGRMLMRPGGGAFGVRRLLVEI